MSINLGPERTLHFHTTDPTDLGITLTHTPTTLAMGISTGYVRITSLVADGGMVTGDVRLNDVVVEAAGVNMRRPISEGMWRLTLGLMEVAPRPLEIIVAQEVDEDEVEQEGGLSNQITGLEDDKQHSYYQLETPMKYNVENDPVLAVKQYGLEDSCDLNGTMVATPDGMLTPNQSPGEHSPMESPILHNPFDDPDRFGPERNIVFRTESLGVKLHRSATEGIVHILHVTSYEPPKDSTQLPPRDGDLSEGDAIMEVGGVDLRNQCIGRIEWADMVHFIRYVERPLEMVVAKDTFFTRERAGLSPLKKELVCQVQKGKSESEEKKEDETNLANIEDDGDEVKEVDKTSETIVTEAPQDLSKDCLSPVIDSVCGAVADGMCASPGAARKTNADVDDVCATLGAASTSYADGDNTRPMHSPLTKVISPGNTKKDDSWIGTKVVDDDDETKSVRSPSRSPVSFFHRTHPTPERDSVIPYSVVPVSPAAKSEAGDSDSVASQGIVAPPAIKSTLEDLSPGAKNTIDDSAGVISPGRKSVAELRGLFSPIKLPEMPKSPAPVSSLEKKDDVAETPVSPFTESLDHIACTASPTSCKNGDGAEEEVQVADDCVNASPTEVVDDSPVHENETLVVCGQEPSEVETAVNTTDLMPCAPNCIPCAPNDISIEPRSDEVTALTMSDLDKTIDFDKVSDVPVTPRELSQSEAEETKLTETSLSEPVPEEGVEDVSATVNDQSQPREIEDKQVNVQPAAPTEVIKNSYAEELGPTPEKPFDETANSSLHEELLNDLASEFTSPSEKSVQPSDSRDDIEQNKHRDDELKKKLISPADAKNVSICPKPEKAGSPLSPPAATKKTFNSLFEMDDTDSPFCGNIKFSDSSKDKIPSSALFSQAFVVQRTGMESKGPPVTDHIRWESTNSPLFLMKKSMPNASQKTSLGWSPYPPVERTGPESLFPDPLIAFDMAELDVTLNSSLDDGSLSDDPSYNPNDTIVYADEIEAQADCCGFDNFCADNMMFEGLVSNCGANPETQRMTKEKANKVPSPRRKNLLSRLRKGSKKNKDKVAYGNLNDADKEAMKGIKKAHVQLRKQNIYGKSLESASQYAPMSDLIEI